MDGCAQSHGPSALCLFPLGGDRANFFSGFFCPDMGEKASLDDGLSRWAVLTGVRGFVFHVFRPPCPFTTLQSSLFPILCDFLECHCFSLGKTQEDGLNHPIDQANRYSGHPHLRATPSLLVSQRGPLPQTLSELHDLPSDIEERGTPAFPQINSPKSRHLLLRYSH